MNWVRNRADELAVDEGCRFDLAAADKVRRFFSQFLRHSKGEWAGKPFELLDWQWQDVIAPLFGWKRANGTRRYRRGYVEIPKKNGKSTIGAGIELYLTCADGEQGAEVYTAAADREQAGIVHGEAASMVRASPSLAKRCQVIDSTKRILFFPTGSFCKALSCDVPTKEGVNAHGLIFDELHAQAKPDLYNTLMYAGAARLQPLFLDITTAGFDRESICYQQHLYAKAVLEGRTIDSSFFPYIRAADQEDDWRDPAVWRKANPSLGVTISEESMAEDFRKAANSPALENSFRRYRLNQWTDADVRWIPSERWDACDLPVPGNLMFQPCYAGLDLSSTLDTTSLVLIFPHDDGTWSLLLYCWVPERACRERERLNKTRFDLWAAQGHMEKTPGDSIDYQVIRRRIRDGLGHQFDIREIAFDPWSATALAQDLAGDGFTCVQFRQGFASMSEPSKEFEKLVLGKKIRHGQNPVMRWMVGNTSVESDAAGNIKPSKKASREKIDGVVAAVMALGRAMVRQELGSVYERETIKSV